MVRMIREFNLPPEENVRRDFELFHTAGGYGSPILIRAHTFGAYCVTAGFFSPHKERTIKILKRSGIQIFRRITGGALAFHGEDMCLSMFVASPPSRRFKYPPFLNLVRKILSGLLHEGTGLEVESVRNSDSGSVRNEFCVTRLDDTSLYTGGAKFAGFAGRVKKNMFLLQVQLNAASSMGDLLGELDGTSVRLARGYFEMKKFVFSDDFLENIRMRIEEASFAGPDHDFQGMGCLAAQRW